MHINIEVLRILHALLIWRIVQIEIRPCVRFVDRFQINIVDLEYFMLSCNSSKTFSTPNAIWTSVSTGARFGVYTYTWTSSCIE